MSHDSSDEDDDLKKAIALSMQDSKLLVSPPRDPVVIDLTSDEETDDLDRVVVREQLPSYSPSGLDKDICELTPGSCQSGLRVSYNENQRGKPLVIRPQVSSPGTKNSNGRTTINAANQNKPKSSNPSEPKEIMSTITGLGGLDRRKMEEERLARAGKRKVAHSPLENCESVDSTHRSFVAFSDSTEPPLKRRVRKSNLESFEMLDQPLKATEVHVRDRDDSTDKTNAKLMNSKPTTLADIESLTYAQGSAENIVNFNRTKMPEVQSYQSQQAQMRPGPQYPHGVVKQTWAYGFPRLGDIKIEEVLQKNDLDLAVLSSFQWDEEWILSKLDMKRTKLILVAQATSAEEKEEIRKNAPPNVRFCFPSMDGSIRTMHSKLQLLAHPSHLRVVIPTANLVPYDWGETGVMENTVFLIDLPRLTDNRIAAVDSLTPFGRELRLFLKAMGMDSKITDSLLKFDFSQTADLAFVHTIGGSHSGSDWKGTGYPGLGSAIRELGLSNSSPLEVTVVSASIGALTDDFVMAILLACKGDDGLTELEWRTSSPPASRKCSPEEQILLMEIEEGFRILFPSHETVRASKGGIGCGGTICFQSKWYQRKQFPKELFLDCKSKRAGLLMHSKLLFTTPTNVKTDGDRSEAWAYVGSANLSESAWGHLSKNKSTKQIKLNCRNWECGVIIPVNSSVGRQARNAITPANTPQRATAQEHDLDSIFDGVVPVPMVFPSVGYEGGSPWFYDER